MKLQQCVMICSTKYEKVSMLVIFFLYKSCAFSVKDKGSGGHAGIDMFLLSLMTPIPFHGLVSRLNQSL